MVVFVTKMTNRQRVGMLSFVVRELSVFFTIVHNSNNNSIDNNNYNDGNNN